MKFLHLPLSALLFMSVFNSFGQNSHHHHDGAVHPCHTDERTEKLLEENPEWIPFVEEANNELERFTRDFEESGAAGERSVKIIPVVFHVIHANGPENISTEQIEDCIRVMTDDFTRQNSDISLVVPAFQDITADVGVEFRLAKLDPNGNCTNGIVRVENQATFDGGENLKSISPAWPRAKYMNVWVCNNISGNAAGYTYTPGTVAGPWGAAADGIVVQHSYVGSIGTASPTTSRTMTHEVGHWINLRHPWGGSNTPGLASNCDIDDGVADTPNTIGWTSCNLNGSSCGSLDNVQNFMEYSYCSRMFTNGQRTRMLAALNSNTASRSNLWSANNLAETGVLTDGVLCNAQFSASKQEVCAGDSVVYTDMSYHNVTTRSWTFAGGTPSTATGEQVVVYYNEPGNYNVTLQVSDGSNSVSSTEVGFVHVRPSEGVALPYSQDFESYGSQAPNPADFEMDWQYGNTITSSSWEVTNFASGASGTHTLRLPNRNLAAGSVSEIISKPIDLSNTTTDVVISFKYAYARRNPSNNERMRFWVSADCGETWSLRGIWSNNFETAPFTNVNWFPSSPGHWEQVEITNILENHLVENFRFKFSFESDGGNNFFVDDINISGPLVSSVEDMDISQQITVFPVPTTDLLNIALYGVDPYMYHVELYNPVGQLVYATGQNAFPGGSDQITLDTRSYAAGIYHMVLLNDKGQRAVKRVVVAR